MSESLPVPDVAIGIDVGGTFTDIVVIDRAIGAMEVDKVLSTPERLSVGIMGGLQKVLGTRLTAAMPRARIIHATTQATNALIEGKTAKIALITNRGFRDVLEIRRHYRTDLYNMFLEVPPPLVPRDRRVEVDGRLDFRGEVITPLDVEAVAAAARALKAQAVRAYAICFLHSYACPDHEETAARIVREVHPEAFVTCSSGVCPEYREYERTSTTVVNAAVMPIVGEYLDEMERELERLGHRRDLYIMQSNGGMTTARDIRLTPVNIIESGPAAGVVAAAAIGQLTGCKNLLSLDMGGTTAKAALIHQGVVEMTSEYEVGGLGHGGERQEGYPIRVPVMELVEVGSGGGSIAWIDEAGALRVGPRSAGADPGPVCYGKGGTEPTTTDADLVLGRLSAEFFLGGEMALDEKHARWAIDERISKPLGMDVMEAAAGIVEVANSHMVRALRRVSVQKGRHPRDYTLVALGGAGPLHAADLAAEMGVREVIVPPFPGVASAIGLLGSDIRHDYQQAYFSPLLEADCRAVTERLEQMAERGRSQLARSGMPPDAIRIVPAADLRYVGQAYEVCVEWSAVGVTSRDLVEMKRRFNAEHQRLYSFANDSRAVELVSLRVTAIGVVNKLIGGGVEPKRGEPQPKQRRPVYFGRGGVLDVPVYDRAGLGLGQVLAGPAIVEQRDSTTVVPPGWTAVTDRFGHLVLSREG
jgi:N-methylhydantoinase A